MAFSHGTPNSIVTDGLVFYVDAANKESYPGSGTTVNDLINNNITGSMSGATYATSNAGVFNFDGSSDEIDFSTLNITGNFTISLWADTNSTSYQTAIQLSNSTTTGTNDSTIFVRNTYEANRWGFYDGSTVLLGAVLDLNRWYNLVMTKNSTTYTIFLNAEQENQNTKNNINIEDFLIGRRSYSNFYYNGNIATTQVYNRELSVSEIKQNYNALKGRFI